MYAPLSLVFASRPAGSSGPDTRTVAPGSTPPCESFTTPEMQPVSWAWAVNGCASVLSAILATLLAINLGATAVVLLAVLLYLLAALVFAGPGPVSRPA